MGRGVETTQDSKTTRRFPRVPSRQPVLVKLRRAADPGEVNHLVTVSLGGCMFLFDRPLRPNAPLELAILVGRRIAHARARVVYQSRRRDGLYETGAEFVETTPHDREVLGLLIGETEARLDS
jgi:hypothetical protein